MLTKEEYQQMSDDELNDYLVEIYADEAARFDLTVDQLFHMPILRAWLRAGWPDEYKGMSKGMIKLAKIGLRDKNLLAE